MRHDDVIALLIQNGIQPSAQRVAVADYVLFTDEHPSADRVFAIDDHCPHKGGPLSQGIVHGAAVTCPLHNWVISLETGKALGADEGCVRTIPVKVEGDLLFIALEAHAHKAA